MRGFHFNAPFNIIVENKKDVNYNQSLARSAGNGYT